MHGKRDGNDKLQGNLAIITAVAEGAIKISLDIM